MNEFMLLYSQQPHTPTKEKTRVAAGFSAGYPRKDQALVIDSYYTARAFFRKQFVAPLAQIGYNSLIRTKRNGRADNTSASDHQTKGTRPMADVYSTYSNTESKPTSEQLELRFDEESPYDPASAIPDFDHARNTYHHLTPNRIEQFWNSCDKSGGEDTCWNWKKVKTYGEYYLGTHKERTHRLAYNLTYGDIPDKMEVCHTCDNPSCCNPKHLFLGTHQQNCQDRDRKKRGRRAVGRRRGLVDAPPDTIREKDYRSGTNNGQAKLTEDDVRAIRTVYATGTISQRKLAAQYHVNASLIGFIVRRKYWRHVE